MSPVTDLPDAMEDAGTPADTALADVLFSDVDDLDVSSDLALDEPKADAPLDVAADDIAVAENCTFEPVPTPPACTASAAPCDFTKPLFVPNPYAVVFQLELLDPKTSPLGVPSGMVCTSVPYVVLLRITWSNCWADNGCGDGGPCGSDCFSTTGYAYVIDPIARKVLWSKKELLTQWSTTNPPPVLQTVKGGPENEFIADAPLAGIRVTVTSGALPYGDLNDGIGAWIKTSSMPGWARVSDLKSSTVLGTIDLPL